MLGSSYNESVLFIYLQNGDEDIISPSIVVTFQPADLTSTVTIATVNDDIPEKSEVFEMRLTSTDSQVVVGGQHTATITIPANDFAAGNFSFQVRLLGYNDKLAVF